MLLRKASLNAENLSCDYAKLKIKISVLDFINFHETRTDQLIPFVVCTSVDLNHIDILMDFFHILIFHNLFRTFFFGAGLGQDNCMIIVQIFRGLKCGSAGSKFRICGASISNSKQKGTMAHYR